MTLTFLSDYGSKHAVRAFDNLRRRFIEANATHWVKILDFTRKGRRHFHLLVQCRENIATGTDLGAVMRYHETCRAHSRPYADRRNLRNTTTKNVFLLRIWKWLDVELRGLGFGWEFDFFPLYNRGGTVTYLVERAFSPSRQKTNGKRVVSIRFSSGCPRADKLSRSEWFEARLGALLAACGQDNESYLREKWGQAWACILSNVLAPKLEEMQPDWHEQPSGRVAALIVDLSLSEASMRRFMNPVFRDLITQAYGRNGVPAPNATANERPF